LESSFHVWFIRPLLREALALPNFLAAEQDLGLSERIAILTRVARALASLEAAGYVHQAIDARSILFIPYPLLGSSITEPNVRTVAKQRYLFNVRASRPYHQELMGMADVRRASPDEPDQTPSGLLQIASEMDVLTSLPRKFSEPPRRIESMHTWAERARILSVIEGAIQGPQ
jgi:hypothetical protein